MKKLLSIICVGGLILSFGSVSALETPKLKPRPKPAQPPKPLTSENQPIDYYQMKDVSMLEGLLYDNPDTLASVDKGIHYKKLKMDCQPVNNAA